MIFFTMKYFQLGLSGSTTKIQLSLNLDNILMGKVPSMHRFQPYWHINRWWNKWNQNKSIKKSQDKSIALLDWFSLRWSVGHHSSISKVTTTLCFHVLLQLMIQIYWITVIRKLQTEKVHLYSLCASFFLLTTMCKSKKHKLHRLCTRARN